MNRYDAALKRKPEKVKVNCKYADGCGDPRHCPDKDCTRFKEESIREIMSTEEGRRKLAESMANPLRTGLDYPPPLVRDRLRMADFAELERRLAVMQMDPVVKEAIDTIGSVTLSDDVQRMYEYMRTVTARALSVPESVINDMPVSGVHVAMERLIQQEQERQHALTERLLQQQMSAVDPRLRPVESNEGQREKH